MVGTAATPVTASFWPPLALLALVRLPEASRRRSSAITSTRQALSAFDRAEPVMETVSAARYAFTWLSVPRITSADSLPL